MSETAWYRLNELGWCDIDTEEICQLPTHVAPTLAMNEGSGAIPVDSEFDRMQDDAITLHKVPQNLGVDGEEQNKNCGFSTLLLHSGDPYMNTATQKLRKCTKQPLTCDTIPAALSESPHNTTDECDFSYSLVLHDEPTKRKRCFPSLLRDQIPLSSECSKYQNIFPEHFRSRCSTESLSSKSPAPFVDASNSFLQNDSENSSLLFELLNNNESPRNFSPNYKKLKIA